MTVTCFMCGRENILLTATITGPVYRPHADKLGRNCYMSGQPCGEAAMTFTDREETYHAR